MKRILSLLIVLLLALIAGWWLLSAPPPAAGNARLEQDRRDKQYIDDARARKDLAALEVFIRQNPNSNWRQVAVFYRDEFAYQKAVAEGSMESLERYIRQYPQSQWNTFARQRLEQIRRERKAEQDRRDRQRKLAGKPVPTVVDGAAPAAQENAPAQAVIDAPARTATDARERVQRALSIYQQQREQKQYESRQQLQKKRAEQQRQRNCQVMRDQLRQFDSNIRWYRLDAQGQRVFLDEQAVAAKRRETENYLKRNCR